MSAAQAAQDADAHVMDRQPGISGRRFTLFFVGLLVACLVVGVPVVLRFAHTQDMLEEARQSWPKAAEQLEHRYAAVERFCASKQIELPENWRSVRDRFRKNVIYDNQASLANELEGLLGANPGWHPASDSPDQAPFAAFAENEFFIKFEKSQQRLTSSHTDMLGKVTDFCFRLSQPPQFQVPKS
jgi:hypothetical protein